MVLIAVAALTARAWWVAVPALALCAVTPFVVDQDDLDAQWGNALPALGVALALGLTIAAWRRGGASYAPRAVGDPLRIAVAIVVIVLSLPWFAADLGFHFPGDVFMGEERFEEADGSVIAAVHLGQHHGQYGTLMLLSALLLSRMRLDPGGLRVAATGLIALLGAYGIVNMVQDGWNEQLVEARLGRRFDPDPRSCRDSTRSGSSCSGWRRCSHSRSVRSANGSRRIRLRP